MKPVLTSFLALSLLCSCGGRGNSNNVAPVPEPVAQTQTQTQTQTKGPVFAPKQKQTIVTRTPIANQAEDVMRFQGAVRFMITIPEDFETRTAQMLTNKLMAIASVNGVGAIGGDPGLCMVPVLNVLSAGVTTTAPVKHKVTYDFGIYVGNLGTGDIYGSVQHTIMGVGDSEELAMINAVSSISVDNNRYQQMLQNAQEQVLSYFNANGEVVLNMAQGYIASKQYGEAMAVLNSVPGACAELYAKAVALKNEVLIKRFETNADELVAKMEAALGLARDDMNGYCAEAMSYYAMIQTGTPAKAKADEVYAKYLSSLDPNAKLNWERECRQWESDERERERTHALNVYREEMATKIAIEGQTALLNKYKLDESHNKRGAFWKFFYNREE